MCVSFPVAKTGNMRVTIFIVGIAVALRELSAFSFLPANHPPLRCWKNPTHRAGSTVLLHSSLENGDDDNATTTENYIKEEDHSNFFRRASFVVTSNPQRSVLFSLGMTLAGATLGPFLDTYHSALGVLHYNHPITATLWSSSLEHPALITAWWVPELFGVAGFVIGWLYIVLDAAAGRSSCSTTPKSPSVPKILLGISLFTFQYWCSGVLVAAGVDRGTILNVMSVLAASGFVRLDGTWAGWVTSTATALGGPLIEVVLLSLSRAGALGNGDGYAYTDLGETGFFPLWICPVYFLGGPANGNLARGLWNAISLRLERNPVNPSSPTTDVECCQVCRNTRTIPCPNCDGKGDYVAMGGRRISCTSCRGRGYVICRDCFGSYGEDPYDIEAIREKMSRMPD